MGTSNTGGKGLIWLILVLLILATIVLVYPGHRRIAKWFVHGSGVSRPAWQPDCQQDSVYIDQSDTVIVAADLTLIGPIANFPEYHDCQRFITDTPVDGADQYGPLVAIWAANHLETAFQKDRMIPVPTPSTTTMVPTQDQLIRAATGIPVAVIYDFDDSYSHLGIEHEFNCLYLAQIPTSPVTWIGKMVPIGKLPTGADPAHQCLEPRQFITLAGFSLTVQPLELPSPLTAADIPPVARWEWDPKTRKQAIGIRCGDQWCDIGEGSFAPYTNPDLARLTPVLRHTIEAWPAGLTATGVSTQETDRITAIKGWYDEQLLSILDPATNKLKPSTVTGIAFPHPMLDRLGATSGPGAVKPGDWIPSSYVYVDADYPGTVHLYQGLNRISLCSGTADQCNVPSPVPVCSAKQMDAGHPAWSRVVPDEGKGPTTYYCVRQRHINAIPAGTVRWRWTEHDELHWIRCPTTGCCTLN